MLRLAEVEVKDALRDLAEAPVSTTSATTAPLNATAQQSFTSAINAIEAARAAAYEADRVLAVKNARQLLVSASSSIDTNLTYQIGQGVAMFRGRRGEAAGITANGSVRGGFVRRRGECPGWCRNQRQSR